MSGCLIHMLLIGISYFENARGISYHKLQNPYILIESTNITKINQIEQEQKSQT